MKKMTKLLIIILFTLIILTIGLFLRNGHREAREREQYMNRKVNYATSMDFVVRNRSYMWSVCSEFSRDPEGANFTEVVFVHSPEEALHFPEYVLVAFPGEEFLPGRGTQRSIEMLVWIIRYNNPNIDFRDYGLPENDITIIDVVDNWEIVYELSSRYGRRPRFN